MATGRGTGDLSMVAKDIIAALNAENVQTNENTKAVKENKKAVEQSVSAKKKSTEANKTSANTIKELKEQIKSLSQEISNQNKTINNQAKQIDKLTEKYKKFVETVKSASTATENPGFLKGVQTGSKKLKSTEGSKTLDVGLNLTPERISSAEVTDVGISKVYEIGALKARTFIGATEEAEEQIKSIMITQKEYNQVVQDAVNVQQKLAEELRKSGLSEDEVGQNQEYQQLANEIENYKESFKSLQNYLADPKIQANESLGALNNALDNGQEKIKKFSEIAQQEIEELTHKANSMEEVFSKLSEEGVDFSKFTFQGETGNITKYADELGRVVKITKQFDKEGKETYVYSLNNNFGTLSNTVEKTYNKIQKLNNGIVNLKKTAETKKAEEVKLAIDEVYESLVKLENEITNAKNAQNKAEVNKLTVQYGTQKKKLDELAGSYQKLTAEIKNQGGWMLNLKDSWQKAFRSFTTYMSVTTLFYQGIHAVKSMVEEVKELDDSLTEFKKVSDLAGDSLDNYVKKAYEAGEAVAKTGREMIEAATEFKKSGYDDDASLELGEIALMYSNIADEEVNAGDAASFIIAQLKAFNLEAENSAETLENAQHIIDAVNEVSNEFAVSSADIAENLGTASAVMANAGNTLEETIGLNNRSSKTSLIDWEVLRGLHTKLCW